VDCGAYVGDTLLSIRNSNISVDCVVAFEPDQNNFLKLSKTISTDWHFPATLFPCGVHSATQQLRFMRDGGEGGRLDDAGTDIIQVIALDDVLHGLKPNLIKMDIEGAEIAGLMGAKKTIENDRPGLAICVYHQPQHLWQIPSLIKQWDLGYKFYLRSHANNGFDVVMYAVSQ
jgi:FkbM family methyltransferase